MNSHEDVLARLLRLFPVDIVRERFPGIPGYQDELIKSIIEQHDERAILNFSFDNFDYSKQHIYLFKHDINDLSSLPESLLKNIESQFRNLDESSLTFFYWLDLRYDVILINPIEQTFIDFKWPVKVVIDKGLIIITFAIIERNIKLLLKQIYKNRKSFITGKNIEEQSIVNLFTKELRNFGNVSPYNLEKGVKELWKNDIVDAVYVNYKKSKSTSVEYMDEELTLKEQYNTLYEEIMYAPLYKIVLKFLIDIDKYGDHLTVDPSIGVITLSTFSKSKERPINAIRKILEKN